MTKEKHIHDYQRNMLQRVIAEEVIGPDEPEPNEIGFLSEQGDVLENERAEARNKVKAEQRKRLEVLFGNRGSSQHPSTSKVLEHEADNLNAGGAG